MNSNMLSFLKLFLFICLFTIARGNKHNDDDSVSQNDANILFDLPDITTLYTHDHDVVQLEAFKSSLNDDILKQKNESEYGKLIWVSLGNPTLIRTQDIRNKSISRLFHFSPEGIYTYIEMLTKSQRESLLQVIRAKYKIDAKLYQVVNLVLSRFHCTINLYTNGHKLVLVGEVTEFRKFPLRINFWAPTNTKERSLFRQRLFENELEEHSDLEVKCEIASRGRELKTNSLTLTVNQMSFLELSDKIFGPANTTYVTRYQLSNLGYELYNSLNIVEEYQMPLYQFNEEFVQGIINQAASTTFTKVSIDEAINSLSKYSTNFDGDIKADVIKSDLAKIYQVKAENNLKYIKLNEENFESFKNQYKTNLAGQGGGSFLGIIEFGASGDSSKETTRDWAKSGLTLNEQLKQLNTQSENDIAWEIDGERVIPKSINVAKLNKASFSKTLFFNRIRRQYYDASFQRKFSLYTSKFSDKPLVTKFPKSTIVAVSLENILNFFDENGKGFGEYLGWYLCDGRNGAPNLSGRFLVGYDPASKHYNKIGNVGGLDFVNLAVNQMPSHTHHDSGHAHYISLPTTTGGHHSHSYQDIYYSEYSWLSSNYVHIPSGIGTNGKKDHDNVGHQMGRETSHSGTHSHHVNGMTQSATVNLSPSGGSQPHENRPPYYVVSYIIFLDIV